MKYTYEMSREIKALMNGNTAAFQNLYLMTVNDVYFHVRLVIANQDEANRMVVKIFKNMYIHFDKLDRPENTMKWMNGIMYRCLMDWANLHCGVFLMDEEDGKYKDYPVNRDYIYAETMLTEAESANLAANYITELSPVLALTGLAYFYDNIEIEQIADFLQCDDLVVQSRTRYARKYIEHYCRDYAKSNKLETSKVDVHLLLLSYVILSKNYSVQDAGGLYSAIIEAIG